MNLRMPTDARSARFADVFAIGAIGVDIAMAGTATGDTGVTTTGHGAGINRPQQPAAAVDRHATATP